MKEISLHILDIVKNSVRAKATLIEISVSEVDATLTFTVKDNGCGMDEEMLAAVKNPFTTTRTTRKVGLGIPLLTLAAQQTGGDVDIISNTGENSGTTLSATFRTDHIDCMPLGNMVDTICTLIQGSPAVDFIFSHRKGNGNVYLSTVEMREILGGDIPLDNPEIFLWIKETLTEEYALLV